MPLATATLRVTDGDGDTATATVNFQVTDANAPTANPAVAAVDDDGLIGPPAGNPASTTGDLDANVGDDPANTSEASFSGTLSFGFGGDGQGATGGIDFAAMNGLTAAIGLETVTYGWNGGTDTLTATITGGPRAARICSRLCSTRRPAPTR